AEERCLAPEHAAELAQAAEVGEPPRQRLERLAIAWQDLEEPLPGLDRARAVAELGVDDAGVPPEENGVGALAAADDDLPLEDAGELRPPLRFLVARRQPPQRLRVAGR